MSFPPQFSEQEHYIMRRALELAQLGQFTTSPNPNVGCVVVKNDQIIAEGWHQKAGTGHAEVNAFSQLTPEQSEGATAFVTLEPCSHYGRTPPCAELLIKAKVAKVIIAMLDPNPLVAGRGVKMLQQAGIEVQSGLLEQQAREINRGFLSRMERKKPFVQVKLASSIDGKTALKNGESKWITGPEARADVQVYRAKSCVILSTAETILADDAKLNVRQSQLPLEYPKTDIIEQVRQPMVVVLDSSARISPELAKTLALFNDEREIVLVRKAPVGDFKDWPKVQELAISYEPEVGFDLTAIVNWCAENECNYLWVEAGATLAASFISEQLYDQLIVYMAPKIMGQEARDMLPVGPFEQMSQLSELTFKAVETVGTDIKVILEKGE